jgi:hypothetical protein
MPKLGRSYMHEYTISIDMSRRPNIRMSCPNLSLPSWHTVQHKCWQEAAVQLASSAAGSKKPMHEERVSQMPLTEQGLLERGYCSSYLENEAVSSGVGEGHGEVHLLSECCSIQGPLQRCSTGSCLTATP